MNYPSPASSASAPPVIRAVIGPPQSSSIISSSSPPLSYFFPSTQSDPLGNCHALLHLAAPPTPSLYRRPPLPAPFHVDVAANHTLPRGRRLRRSDEKIRLEMRSVSRLKTNQFLPAPPHGRCHRHTLLSASEPPPPPPPSTCRLSSLLGG